VGWVGGGGSVGKCRVTEGGDGAGVGQGRIGADHTTRAWAYARDYGVMCVRDGDVFE
jgi:hypothetical protein